MDHLDKNFPHDEHLDFLKGLKEPGFEVPEGYFDHLANMTSLKANISDDLTLGMQVPENYFSKLEAQVMAQVQLEQLDLSKGNAGFAYPDGYFDQLENKIWNRVQSEPTKVRRLLPTRYLRWAAAACVTSFLAVSIYLQMSQEVKTTAQETSNLSSISDASLLAYLETYSETGDLIYLSSYMDEEANSSGIDQSISADEIEQYLANTL